MKLDLEEVEVIVRDVKGTSADTAAENIVRKQLSPLGEARAVGAMLEEGLTLDGAAEALGWTRELVRHGRSNDAPMGYLPVLTNLTHWPWFLNLVPKFFQPPFLH